MAYETGTITQIDQEEVINEKLTKRRFWIEKDDKYKDPMCFDLLNDRTDLIDPYATGEKVKVSFNVKSNLHNDRVYHNLSAWKLERV